MYCSSCGVSVAQGLVYCKNCGAKLSRDSENRSSEVRPESLIFACMATFIFGLGAITVLIGVMKTVLAVPVERIIPFALLPFLMMLALEVVFIRLLLQRTRRPDVTTNTLPSREQTTRELDATHPRALPEPLPSVTEHTTRVLDPVHTERK